MTQGSVKPPEPAEQDVSGGAAARQCRAAQHQAHTAPWHSPAVNQTLTKGLAPAPMIPQLSPCAGDVPLPSALIPQQDNS